MQTFVRTLMVGILMCVFSIASIPFLVTYSKAQNELPPPAPKNGGQAVQQPVAAPKGQFVEMASIDGIRVYLYRDAATAFYVLKVDDSKDFTVVPLMHPLGGQQEQPEQERPPARPAATPAQPEGNTPRPDPNPFKPRPEKAAPAPAKTPSVAP